MPSGIGAAAAARKPLPSTTVPNPALLRAGATWPGFALAVIANQLQSKYKTTALRGCPASAHGGARASRTSARLRIVLTGGSGSLTGSHPLGSASSTQLLHNAAFCLVGHQSRAKRVWCWPTPAASGLNKTGRYAKCLPWALRPAPALPGRGPCPALRSGSGRAAWRAWRSCFSQCASRSVSVSGLRPCHGCWPPAHPLLVRFAHIVRALARPPPRGGLPPGRGCLQHFVPQWSASVLPAAPCGRGGKRLGQRGFAPAAAAAAACPCSLFKQSAASQTWCAWRVFFCGFSTDLPPDAADNCFCCFGLVLTLF